jgi:cell division protein FtsL
MNTSKTEIGKSDKPFIAMIAVTTILVAAILFSNARRALHPELESALRIDVKKVVERIDKAGLKPMDARYYRIVE